MPLEIASGLEDNVYSSSDIKVKHCGTQKWSDITNNVRWYHHWEKTSEGDSWLSAGYCRNGWYLLHFDKGVDFLISHNGNEIYYSISSGFPVCDVLTVLSNQVIPMVMNLRGTEVLHASSIWTPNGAAAFVGNGGYGKSTLAASLVQKGSPLLSDDAVPLIYHGQEFWTTSGLPIMGLWPRAQRLVSINGKPYKPYEKTRIKLNSTQYKSGEFPLACIYFLKPTEKNTTIEIISMPIQQTLIELVRAAHRLDLNDHNMLQRQFNTLKQVAELIPSKVIIYPKGIPDIEKLRSALLCDFHNNKSINNLALVKI